ncbi:tetratricopeptide repeat protein [Streptomyces fradiae]|uniref:tetratricopeptide repeat protein n=1 Tax=Streptomyces fradiae TaxID=1906 RepID=UPI0036C27CB9
MERAVRPARRRAGRAALPAGGGRRPGGRGADVTGAEAGAGAGPGRHRRVRAADAGHGGAVFGPARALPAVGGRGGAVRTLESVPELSSHPTAASRGAAVRARLRRRGTRKPLRDGLYPAARETAGPDALGRGPVRRERLSAELLGPAPDRRLTGRLDGQAPDHTPLGGEPGGRGWRLGPERSYRALARLARSGGERIEPAERAHRFRPRTWV